MSEYVPALDAPSTSEAPELHFPGEPDSVILWAAAGTGGTVRCLFHHEQRPSWPVCNESQDWCLFQALKIRIGDDAKGSGA